MATWALVNLSMVWTNDFPPPCHSVVGSRGDERDLWVQDLQTSSFPRRWESIVFICPCGVPLCQGFVVQAMDTRRCGYDVCGAQDFYL